MNFNRKETVRRFLEMRDWEGLSDWAKTERSAIRVVSASLLSDDALMSWRATEALGKLAGQKARMNGANSVRAIVRRLLWGMNDESGSIIWNAPEAIAEILVNVPELTDKYGRIVASFIDLEPFPRGVHWAIARLSEIKSNVFSDMIAVLRVSLASQDPAIRAFAAKVLVKMQVLSSDDIERNLLRDEAEFQMYDMGIGEMISITVAAYCRRVIK